MKDRRKFACPKEGKTFIDLTNDCGTFYMRKIVGENIEVVGKQLYEHVDGFSCSTEPPRTRLVKLGTMVRRFIWSGKIFPRPLVATGESDWFINGRPANEKERDAAIKNIAMFRLGEWRTEYFLDGKPATDEEISDVWHEYRDLSAATILGIGTNDEIDPITQIEDSHRRQDVMRVGLELRKTIVDLLDQPDPKVAKVEEITVELVKSGKQHQYKGKPEPEYEIRIHGKFNDPLLDSLNGLPARIRRCERINCTNYFWATRIDSKGCRECGDAIRTARRRKPKSNKIKERLNNVRNI